MHVIVEGQTEAAFVNEVIGPALSQNEVYLDARLLGTSGHQGGRVSYERVKNDIRRFLKQDPTAYCTTLIDYYGRRPGFPGETSSSTLSPARHAEQIEQAILSDIASDIPGLRPDVRLIPYIQLHEFEGLLFSDPATLASTIALTDPVGQQKTRVAFQKIRNQFASPEDINNGPLTAPSKRIREVCPGYDKIGHGTLAAEAIGLNTIRAECPHFNAWITRLENLEPL